MKFKFKPYILIGATLLTVSCSDKEDWTPGEQENKTIGVYFDEMENYSYIIEPDDSRLITINLGRVDSESAATVPIKALKCPEGVVIPQSVSFEAGQQNASFDIDVSPIPLKSAEKIVLQIDPAYSSLYAAGTSMLTLDVNLTGGWVLLADNVSVTYDGTTNYPAETTQIYALDGANHFKIPNFMNSGIDLLFEVSDTTSDYPDLLPYSNAQWYAQLFPGDNDDYKCWYLYDSKNEEYPNWSPDGSAPLIDYAMFYGNGYSYIGLNEGYGSLYVSLDFMDGTSGWSFIYLSFQPLFNPFEEK